MDRCTRITPDGGRCGAPAAGTYVEHGRLGRLAEIPRCAGCWPHGAGPVPSSEESNS